MPEDVWSLRNETTGEVGTFAPGTVRPEVRRRHRYHSPGRFAWHVVNDDAYGDALRYLRGSEVHVFAALPLLMLKDNVLTFSQNYAAEFVGLSQPAISRAMSRLREIYIIGEVEGLLRFSPEIAWKGYATDVDWAIKVWCEAKARWIAERKERLKEFSE